MYIDRTSDFWQAIKDVSNSKNKKAPQLIKSNGIVSYRTDFGKASKVVVCLSLLLKIIMFFNETFLI